MIRPVLFLPPAKSDARAAMSRLDSTRPGFGAIFLQELHAIVGRIEQHPQMYQRCAVGVEGGSLPRFECRRAVLHLFGYAVVYRILTDSIEVVAVLPCRMNPIILTQW